MAKAARFLISLPWIITYVGCLLFYYKQNPGQWARHDLPYISSLLSGQGKDSDSGIVMHFAAWSLAIATTCFARLSLLRQTAGSGPLAWMCAYYTAFIFLLVTACWCAHAQFNPTPWPGCTLHYAASGIFFALGAIESWHFNIRFFRHAWLYQIGIATYIAVYCSLFVAAKKTSLHLPHNLLPIMELMMCVLHVTVDSIYTGKHGAVVADAQDSKPVRSIVVGVPLHIISS
jgi:hypothetical protein